MLEREVEGRIRSLWLEARAAIAAEEERTRQDRDGLLARARIESQEARVQSQKEGRTEGFREGFEKGKAEGRRLGFEQGRIDGSREGRASGRLDEQSRMQAKVGTALEALAAAARDLEEESHGLRHEAQAGVVKLSVGIAAKIIRREVELDASAVMGNVREAVRQIFKGCDVTLQLHPEDVRAVEEALGGNPRWAEDLTNVSVKPASEIARGGCRLLSGAGVVDLTVESQLELVEEALLASVADVSQDADRPDHRVLPDRPEEGGPR